MLTAEARVPTVRAHRYLIQFCHHANHMAHHPGPRSSGAGHDRPPPEVRGVALSSTLGVVRFGSGCCVLQATPDTLLVSVDATGEDELQRLMTGITHRLATIGRRDQLVINWRPVDPAPGLVPGQPPGPTPPLTQPQPTAERRAQRRRRIASVLLVTGGAGLAILVHIGLIGGAHAASVWAKLGVNLVLALVLIKILVVGGHVVLGRFGRRQAQFFPPLRGGRRWLWRRSSSDPSGATGQRHKQET